MGCGSSSSSSSSESKNLGLRLLSSKLHFKPEQLDKLTDYFCELARSDHEESADLVKLEAKVERMVQRLLAGLANLDRRFASCFLVSLNERRRIKQLRFEYLLRLDALSIPSGNSDVAELALQLEEDTSAPGFARLRLKAGDAGSWVEFFGPDGRLRRDLVKAKVAAVLAQSVKPDAINGVDERLCITPGQVVDPEVLDKILKQPEHCRIFFGPAEVDLPVVADHRVVIVEDENGILLKIGLNGSKSQDIQVRLLIGLSINSWPNCVDYPNRVPLHHCDALLHYTAAQTGMYLVAVGPHQGLRCDDKASLWRVRLFAAEKVMREHYSDESVVSLTEAALMQLLDQLRARRPIDFSIKRKGRLRLVSRHILRAIHWWSLEQRAGPDPLRSWSSESLAQHVLLSLDELLRALRCQNLRCYFQPRCNLMLQCARGGTSVHEDAYARDARLLEAYLSALHAYSLEWLHYPAQRGLAAGELLERELVSRWRQVMASLPRGSMSGHYGYGPRQLQYLGLLVKEVLRAKDTLQQGSYDTCRSFFNLSADWQCGEAIDNLIYLLSLVLRQAKDQVSHSSSASSARRRKHNQRRGRAERKRSCAKAYFDRSVDVLIDVVKKDRDTAYLDLDNTTVMAKALLKWLYFGMEEDKKVLGPLLRPYLGNLFNASHEYAWHVESWRARTDRYSAETRSLAAFCKLVAQREIQPANGIVESLSRGWCWPDELARQIERAEPRHGLGLVFLTPERILRYQLKFAKDQGPNSYSTWSKARSLGSAVRKSSVARAAMITANDTLLATLRSLAAKADDVKEKVAGHVELRDRSPLTLAVVTARRRGRQRGPAGLIPALVSLNKFRVLQEVAQLLPAEERNAMLEMVRRVSRDAARRRLRRASCPDPASLVGVQRQLYTPRSESKLYDVSSPAVQDSPNTRQQRIIQERQLQLRREISELHDTLTRGLRSRSQLPTWDSTSMASSSWAASSAANSIGHTRLKRHHTAIWDNVRGTSPLWDSVSCNSTFSRVKTEDAIEANTNDNEKDDDDDRLPTWDLLENALNNKFLTYKSDDQPNSIDGNKDVNVEYLVISNDTKEFAK
ncbi:uncharacterized protein LOC131666180 isoform X2 [Phymastichus coffea]|uniref:uncharacterized protein LOC131666180 isoform X2 n=1 Tax=Phymastichus coffea TaxID=108790 RepID=UPI00273AE13A|nr:uncharacterized protein LOC131666180 isoform X2 [Phymastichus coffea]